MAPRPRCKIITGDRSALEGYIIFHDLMRVQPEEAIELMLYKEVPLNMAVVGQSKELASVGRRRPKTLSLVLACSGKPGEEIKKFGVIEELKKPKPGPALAKKWLEKYGLDSRYVPFLQNLDELNLNSSILSGLATGRFDLLPPMPTPEALHQSLRSGSPLPAGWEKMEHLYFALSYFQELSPHAAAILSIAPDLPLQLLGVMAVYAHRRFR